MTPTRRRFLFAGFATLSSAVILQAEPIITIGWEDLIPPGVPYSQIVGAGDLDMVNDTWRPIFDANGLKLNHDLDGALIRMPGYVIPLDLSSEGVTSFILVPYVGACIHVPPPPPNQLVFVTTEDPWPSESLWEAVWVTGQMTTQPLETDLADIGYTLTARRIELYG